MIGAAPLRTNRRPDRPSATAPAAAALDQGRRRRAEDPQAPSGLVLPPAPRASTSHRPGAVRGRDGGLRARRLDAKGRRPRRRPSASTSGISKSEVSRICAELDEELGGLPGAPPRPRRVPLRVLDATYVKGRVDHQVVSRAVVVATGVTDDRRPRGARLSPSATPRTGPSGRRSCAACEPVGSAVSGSSSPTTTSASKRRSRRSSIGAAWQRCRVHFMRRGGLCGQCRTRPTFFLVATRLVLTRST